MKDSAIKRILLKIYYFGIPIVRKMEYQIDDLYTKIYVKYCPLTKDKIVFDNFWGKGYGDNPKYIADEIIRQNLQWDMVWIVQDMNESFPSQIRKVQWGSNQAMREWASAKMWVDNVRNGSRPKKKKGQFYLQTWHGGMGLKTVEKDAEEYLEKEYILQAQNDGSITDVMVAENQYVSDKYRRAFWYDGGILCLGIPRNDIFFNEKRIKEARDIVRAFYNLDFDCKIVLYAPTFREHTNTETFQLEYSRIIAALSKKFGGTFISMVRLHPNDTSTVAEGIIDATHFPDSQLLLAGCDIVISDFSGMAFDFALMNKPVFLYAKDRDEYFNSERKPAFSLANIPFSFAESESMLINDIEAFEDIIYQEKISCFRERLHYYCNPNSAKDIVEIIRGYTI